ncbi:PAS domain-containing sensor histidine kinase [Desulfobacula toluolica]|uniref:Two component system sensor histidine kinase n=1 Tax=Desulfobacula toluolica (strain DSM 7467 / Tol2) TaxID=651182 RepID=K0NME9_DESTT|nr:PAS domain S-box protein [Desulfobacula toluolica]CCK81860.1 two component system sensor histidine kinase [Desulfobacula toluolica Tol2]
MDCKPTYEELEQKVATLEKRLGQAELEVKALKTSEIEQTAILANIPLFMIIVDQERRVKNVSKSILQFTGRRPEEHIGVRGGDALRCVHHLDDPKGCGFGSSCSDCTVRKIVLDTLNTGKSYVKVETQLSFFDDVQAKRNLLVSTTLLKTWNKNVLIFIEDITERKTAENLLREKKDFLNTLLETITNPIFYKDTNGKYVGCNRAFEKFIGKSRSQIIGKSVYDIGPREIADIYYEKDRELFNKPGKQRYEWKIKRNDGELREVIFDKATLHDTTGNITGLVGVISDITDRKHSEDLVRDLSQRLIQAQDLERKMISCELHDSIAQNLSALKLYCKKLFENQSFPESDIKGLPEDVSSLLDQTITTVRDLAYHLSPLSLDHLGLVPALEVFCEEFAEKNGITIDFQAAGIQRLILNSDTQINLYRLVTEGLNNIRKHASASKAVIRLVGACPNIILRIGDNGKGFDVKEQERSIVNEKRMGLRSMKERVNLLQGRMSINSQLNKGTEIVIKLPLKEK